MLAGVIFDMDGLMYDTEPIWACSLEPALRELGLRLKPGLPDAVRGTAGGELAKVIRDWYGDDVDADRLWTIWHGFVEERLREGLPKKPGLDELLDYLAEAAIPAAVASSSPAYQIEHNLKTSGVADRFAATVSSLDVARAKPEPDVFFRAAELLGSDSSSTIVLEDSFNGVRAGAAGGFYTIMVPDLAQPDDEMRAISTRICSSLLEVRNLLASGEIPREIELEAGI